MSASIINDYMKNKEICFRCKCNKAEIICKECYPFTQFCSNCDSSIHSISTKQSHQRISITQSMNQLSQTKLQMQSQSIDHNAMTNASITLNNNNNTTMNNANLITSEYFNKMKDIFQKEKEDLMNKTFSLEKQLDTAKVTLTNRISSLHSQIETLHHQKENEVNDLKGNYEYELNRLIRESKEETGALIQKNNDAIKNNDDLLMKLHQYMDTIESLNTEIVKLKADNDLRSKQSQQENKDLIEYYEKKLNYFNTNYNEDKSQLINSYENCIEKMKKEYNENKQKMQSLINQREEDIKVFIEENRKECEKLSKENKALKDKCNSHLSEIESIKQSIHDYKYEVEILKQKINILNDEKKKIKAQHSEQNSINEGLIKEIEYLKMTNEKLHRITHGVFKSKG